MHMLVTVLDALPFLPPHCIIWTLHDSHTSPSYGLTVTPLCRQKNSSTHEWLAFFIFDDGTVLKNCNFDHYFRHWSIYSCPSTTTQAGLNPILVWNLQTRSPGCYNRNWRIRSANSFFLRHVRFKPKITPPAQHILVPVGNTNPSQLWPVFARVYSFFLLKRNL